MPGMISSVDEVADVLVGELADSCFSRSAYLPLVRPKRVALLPVEFGRREPEPADTFRLGQHRLEPALDAGLLDQTLSCAMSILPMPNGPSAPAAPRNGGSAFWAISLIRRPNMRRVEPLDKRLAIPAERRPVTLGKLDDDSDRRRRVFLVGRHRVERRPGGPALVGRPQPRHGGLRQRAEVLLDQGLDRRLVEVTDDDDRHQVGPVPVGVELLQPVVLEGLDDLLLADRQPLGVARSLQQIGSCFSCIRAPAPRPAATPRR